MPFRFNYTDRQTIFMQHVEVRLVGGESDAPQVFVGATLDSYGFPADSRLRVEANTASSTWIAFESAVGEMDGGLRPTSSYLTWVGPDDIKTVQFRFKVVDPVDLRLLGATRNRFRLRDEATDIGTMLPAVRGDTGELAYIVTFDEGPLFVLSNEIWPFRRRLMRMPTFRSVALPDVLRQVLERGVITTDPDLEVESDEEGSDRTWFRDWIDWMRSTPSLAGHIDTLEDRVDEELKERWVSEVVRDFASLLGNRFSTRLKSWLEDSES